MVGLWAYFAQSAELERKNWREVPFCILWTFFVLFSQLVWWFAFPFFIFKVFLFCSSSFPVHQPFHSSSPPSPLLSHNCFRQSGVSKRISRSARRRHPSVCILRRRTVREYKTVMLYSVHSGSTAVRNMTRYALTFWLAGVFFLAFECGPLVHIWASL